MFMRRVLGGTAVIAVLAVGAGGAAATGARSYSNCTALNHVYPHGVGRSGAHDHTRSGTNPVTNFKVSNTLYAYNDGGAARHPGERDLDRDNDGVACEQH
jgi:excalibur calcium-binding domain-containing protein